MNRVTGTNQHAVAHRLFKRQCQGTNRGRAPRFASRGPLPALWLSALCGAVIGLVGACSGYHWDDNTYNVHGKGPTPAPAPPLHKYGYPRQAPLLGSAGLQDLVAQYKHHVVVLDFWASWSRQARDELSMLAGLQEELRGQSFQVIACNLDSAEAWSEQTVPILQGAGACYPCVVIAPPDRAELKAWLDPEWNYELPARFVIDRSGVVATASLGRDSIDQLKSRVRQLVRASVGGAASVRLAGDELAVRLKLIDVSAGVGESIGEIVGDHRRLPLLAIDAASRIERQIRGSRNARIAVLPMSALPDRAAAGPLGVTLAEKVTDALRNAGFYDVLRPDRARRMVEGAGQSAMTIEYDPALIKGAIPVDYLVIGWLRGEPSPPTQALAGTPGESNLSAP